MFANNYGKRQRQLAFKSYNQKWKERKDELQRARLVRESSSVVRVGSERCAQSTGPPRRHTPTETTVWTGALTTPPCHTRELGPHRATQTRPPDRWKSTRATCNWQGATWSLLIATVNWPSARNQNGGLCSCQQLLEKQEELLPSSYQDIVSRMP